MITLIKRILEEIQHWLLPIFILLVFGGLLLCAVWGIVEPGNYSEMLQALFALLGTIGLLYTLELQRKTLKSQQEQFAEQAKTQRKEDVKNRFFKMLDYHNQIVSQFSIIDDEGKEYKGREVFIHLVEKHKEIYKILNKQEEQEISIYAKILSLFMIPQDMDKETLWDFVKKQPENFSKGLLQLLSLNLDTNTHPVIIAYNLLYEGFIQDSSRRIQTKYSSNGKIYNLAEFTVVENSGNYYNTHLSVYFRNLYNAVKLVHFNENLKEHEDKTKCEKYQLVSILRAQLSNPEIYILFFNILSQYGEKWSSSGFVGKYHFIKNISKVDLDLVGIDPRDYFKDIDYENYPPKN